jgi:hypothetical protein
MTLLYLSNENEILNRYNNNSSIIIKLKQPITDVMTITLKKFTWFRKGSPIPTLIGNFMILSDQNGEKGRFYAKDMDISTIPNFCTSFNTWVASVFAAELDLSYSVKTNLATLSNNYLNATFYLDFSNIPTLSAWLGFNTKFDILANTIVVSSAIDPLYGINNIYFCLDYIPESDSSYFFWTGNMLPTSVIHDVIPVTDSNWNNSILYDTSNSNTSYFDKPITFKDFTVSLKYFSEGSFINLPVGTSHWSCILEINSFGNLKSGIQRSLY